MGNRALHLGCRCNRGRSLYQWAGQPLQSVVSGVRDRHRLIGVADEWSFVDVAHRGVVSCRAGLPAFPLADSGRVGAAVFSCLSLCHGDVAGEEVVLSGHRETCRYCQCCW